MKRTITITSVILSLILSFFAGSYHGYSNSPGIKNYKRLKDLGMTDDEIAESASNVSQYTADYMETLHTEHMTGAIIGLNTLKSLKEEDLSQIEKLAIGQIASYYNVHVDGEASVDELEMKLQEEIQRLSLDFPQLRKEIDSSKK